MRDMQLYSSTELKYLFALRSSMGTLPELQTHVEGYPSGCPLWIVGCSETACSTASDSVLALWPYSTSTILTFSASTLEWKKTSCIFPVA